MDNIARVRANFLCGVCRYESGARTQLPGCPSSAKDRLVSRPAVARDVESRRLGHQLRARMVDLLRLPREPGVCFPQQPADVLQPLKRRDGPRSGNSIRPPDKEAIVICRFASDVGNGIRHNSL